MQAKHECAWNKNNFLKTCFVNVCSQHVSTGQRTTVPSCTRVLGCWAVVSAQISLSSWLFKGVKKRLIFKILLLCLRVCLSAGSTCRCIRKVLDTLELKLDHKCWCWDLISGLLNNSKCSEPSVQAFLMALSIYLLILFDHAPSVPLLD